MFVHLADSAVAKCRRKDFFSLSWEIESHWSASQEQWLDGASVGVVKWSDLSPHPGREFNAAAAASVLTLGRYVVTQACRQVVTLVFEGSVRVPIRWWDLFDANGA